METPHSSSLDLDKHGMKRDPEEEIKKDEEADDGNVGPQPKKKKSKYFIYPSF